MEAPEIDDLAAILDAEEVVLAAGWAEVRMPRQGVVTLWPVGTLIRLGYLIVDRKRSRDLRSKSALAGLPLDRHMAIVLTSQRLMTFRASRFPRRRRGLLGEVATSEIESATMPYSSSGPMRTVSIRLRRDTHIRFRVDQALAEALIGRFGQADRSR